MTAMRALALKSRRWTVVSYRCVSSRSTARPGRRSRRACIPHAGSSSPTSASASSPTGSRSCSAARSSRRGRPSRSAPAGPCSSRWRSPSSSSTRMGLYERELLALRALHLLTLAKAMLWSAAISALVVYLLHLPIGFDSRITVVGTFTLFFLFAAVVRTLLLSRVLGRRFREDMGGTLVVGWPYRTEPLRERLTMLKGFNHVTLVDGGREQRVVARVTEHLGERTDAGRPAFGSLFVDAGSLTLTQTLDLIAVGRRHGATVYVISNRLRPLTGRRLLIDLFEAPVVRTHRIPGERRRAPLKRAFDIVISAGALLRALPAHAGDRPRREAHVTRAGVPRAGAHRSRRPALQVLQVPQHAQRLRLLGALRVHAGAHQRRGRDEDAVGGGRGGRGLQAGRRSAHHQASAACCGATRSTSCRSSGTCSSAT